MQIKYDTFPDDPYLSRKHVNITIINDLSNEGINLQIHIRKPEVRFKINYVARLDQRKKKKTGRRERERERDFSS